MGHMSGIATVILLSLIGCIFLPGHSGRTYAHAMPPVAMHGGNSCRAYSRYAGVKSELLYEIISAGTCTITARHGQMDGVCTARAMSNPVSVCLKGPTNISLLHPVSQYQRVTKCLDTQKC